jgi:hypothetical protein
MTTLVAGRPFSSRVPTLVVDNKLAVGRHTFQLVVVDDDGNQSAPHQLVVTVNPAVVRPRRRPTPVPPTPPS